MLYFKIYMIHTTLDGSHTIRIRVFERFMQGCSTLWVYNFRKINFNLQNVCCDNHRLSKKYFKFFSIIYLWYIKIWGVGAAPKNEQTITPFEMITFTNTILLLGFTKFLCATTILICITSFCLFVHLKFGLHFSLQLKTEL